MEKSDRSIHNICIAAIKRHTMKPYDFRWTRFYEENEQFHNAYPGIALELTPKELIICSTIIDADNFSVLTTQKLLTKETGIISSGKLNGATDKLYGDFKGALTKSSSSFGLVQLVNGNELKYLIETGKASMVMIYGVRTRIQINVMTDTQMDKVATIWKRKNGQNTDADNPSI